MLDLYYYILLHYIIFYYIIFYILEKSKHKAQTSHIFNSLREACFCNIITTLCMKPMRL